VTKDPSPAVQDFRRARARATLDEILARLTGRPANLLAYDEVQQGLKGEVLSERRLEQIPLDAIVGSVGRYVDFTRSFLPRQDRDEARWIEAREELMDPGPVRPIQVYRIDEVYFVLDGNHRVSAARQLGDSRIWAYVTDVQTKVSLTPAVDAETLILKTEYANFLDETKLDELRPEAELAVTVPGQYRVLQEQIREHRLRLDLEEKQDTSYEEAVRRWYDDVYLPVVRVIRTRNILRYFPERTETDLYVWVSEHRSSLETELGWDIEPGAAARDLAARYSLRPDLVVARMSERILDAVTPSEMEPGPPPGQWRKERRSAGQQGRMFADILVAIDGKEPGWDALDYALMLARHEGARVLGLHVLASGENASGEGARTVKQAFQRRCTRAKAVGNLVVSRGHVPEEVCRRARWADLVVVSLSFPPAPRPAARLGSGMSTIIRRCPTPVLTVPPHPPALQRALLAYDGSPKSREALYVSTYLATEWAVPLVVVTVLEAGRTTSKTLEGAKAYLSERRAEAEFVKGYGPVARVVTRTARARECGLIVMGGYGFDPVREIVLGSQVDEVLRRSRRPVLICR